MTRETAQKLLPVIQAYAEGKDIQCREEGGGPWIDILSPTFSPVTEWRIKPREPREWTIQAVNLNPGYAIYEGDLIRNTERVRVREILPDETP